MLPGEQSLPETILVPDGTAVNQLFAYLCRQADKKVFRDQAYLLQEIQLHWFSKLRSALQCPQCGSNKLIRKGWRSRRLKSSRGKISLFVLQARCKSCGRYFRPLNELIGLPFAVRFTDELVQKSVEVGLQLSFNKSAAIVKKLTGGTISAEGLRRKICQVADSLSFPGLPAGKTVLVDSTKVKAGQKQRGASVHLAITAEEGSKKAGRPSIKKRLLHLHVGGVHRLYNVLSALQPKRLVHDGGEDYTVIAKHSQRCRWHLVHQLKHYLWQDGVPHDIRGRCQESLQDVLWDKRHGQERLATYIKDLEKLGLKQSATHLKGAEKEAFTFKKKGGFAFSTTSPIEREMRELNRRADVGVRWSEKGVENVLKVLFHYRLNAGLINPIRLTELLR